MITRGRIKKHDRCDDVKAAFLTMNVTGNMRHITGLIIEYDSLHEMFTA